MALFHYSLIYTPCNGPRYSIISFPLPSTISATITLPLQMGSQTRNGISAVTRRRRRRPSKVHRSLRPGNIGRTTACGSPVSDKLEALKNLIPSKNGEMKPDQLFQETADYIVLLNTQVLVLQKLIDFYGSQPQENQNENSL